MTRSGSHLVAIVTSFNPPTHYSRFLSEALVGVPGWNPLLIVEKGVGTAPPGITLCECWQPGPLAYLQILRAILRWRPTVVHIQHELTMYGGPVSTLLFPLLLLVLRLIRLPIITTVHAVVAPWEVDHEFLLTFGMGTSAFRKVMLRWLFRLIYRCIGELSDVVIVHSPSLRKTLVDGYRVPQHRVATVPIGIAVYAGGVSEIPCLEKWWDDSLVDEPFFLFFGYLVRRKGLEHLIEAFSQFASTHPSHRLVLAGGTLEYQRPYAERLFTLAQRSLAADRIIFTGFLGTGSIRWLYEHCQAVVLPYAYSISASLPLSFAFEHGKPVLGTALGGLLDDVQNNFNGYLVTPRSVPALRDGLTRLADDAPFRQMLSHGAQATRRDRTWNQCARATAQLYELVAMHRCPPIVRGGRTNDLLPSEREQQ